jgi:hypothetical protein
LGAGGREFKSPRPDHFFTGVQPGIIHGLSTVFVSGEKFIACAKGNRKTFWQISSKKLILRQPVVKQAVYHFRRAIFSVGIGAAKGAWVNRSHAQSDTMHRSRSAVRVAPENRTQRLAGTGAAQKQNRKL